MLLLVVVVGWVVDGLGTELSVWALLLLSKVPFCEATSVMGVDIEEDDVA